MSCRPIFWPQFFGIKLRSWLRAKRETFAETSACVQVFYFACKHNLMCNINYIKNVNTELTNP